MAEISAKVSGHEALVSKIRRLREALPPTVSKERLMGFMERRAKERFDKGEDPNGRPWAPLAPITVLRKRRAGAPYPEKPLLRTLRLRNSIAAIRKGNAAFQFATGAGFRVGVTDDRAAEYGRKHDQGTLPRTPQRRFMGMGLKDVRAFTDLLRREVRKVAGV